MRIFRYFKNSDLRSLKLSCVKEESQVLRVLQIFILELDLILPLDTSSSHLRRQVLLKIEALCSSCFFGQSRYTSVLPGMFLCGS